MKILHMHTQYNCTIGTQVLDMQARAVGLVVGARLHDANVPTAGYILDLHVEDDVKNTDGLQVMAPTGGALN